MAKDVSGYAAQLEAMSKIMQALEQLDQADRNSVLDWVDAQIGRSRSGHKSGDEAGGNQNVSRDESGNARAGRPGTVSTVAQKLGANSCRTVLVAAAAHLTLYQGQDTFTREELIATAKQARGWKVEYSNQMATSIIRLQEAGTLFEKAKDVFSLSDQAMSELETKLAQ